MEGMHYNVQQDAEGQTYLQYADLGHRRADLKHAGQNKRQTSSMEGRKNRRQTKRQTFSMKGRKDEGQT